MQITRTTCAKVLFALLVTTGCGGQAPVAPAVAIPPATPTGLIGALSISEFSIKGWYDGTFHYLPAVSVSAPSNGRIIYVQRVAFTTENAGATTALAGITFGRPQRVVPPGGTLDLLRGVSPVELTSPAALPSIMATVFFTNEEGQAGSVAETTGVPSVAQRPSAATLVIQAFTVTGSYDQRHFHYWPKLTLAETSRVSGALIKKITFELLEVGPDGRVPPDREPREVPAGGTLSLADDDYGFGPWFEITSMADASRVSVVISYVDDQGRGGSVSAVAPVSR